MSRRAVVGVAALVAIGAVAFAQQAPPPQAPPPARAEPARPAPAGQQPPVTFRVQIDYVEVDAIVADRQGNIVRDLTRDDFEVLEDGTPQKIELFSHVDLPVAREERPLFAEGPLEPDVASNVRPFDGRLYAILLDDLHTLPLRSTLVRVAARKFILEHLGANDLAAVVYTSGRADAGQEFTSNKRLLLAAVDRFIGRKLRSSTLERLDEYNRSRGRPSTGTTSRVNDPLDMERGYQARSALDTLKNVAEYLTGIRGRRKALVFFSEGIDYDIYDVFNNRDATTVLDGVRAAIGAATRANVSFYTVDPRGLGGLAQEAMEIGPTPEDPATGITPTSLHDEVRLAQDSLRTLADQTGGFAVVNTNDFAGAFDRIVRENSSYYVLGYYPTNDRRDGRFRRIEVRVKRPGLEVRARKGYVAPRGKRETPALDATAGTSAALRDALNSPLPESGLPMAVQAAAFKGAAPNASVIVTIETGGQQYKFTEAEDTFRDTLEVSLIAVDATGKVRGGDRNSIELKLRPQTRQAVEAFGFRTTSRLELPPGRYQLRVAARATGTGAVGAVHHDLEVPDFSKEPFSISGLVLTSGLAAYTPSARADEMLKEVLPGPPTTARQFRNDDVIGLFAEIYDNQANTPHKVGITTTLRTDAGQVVFSQQDERSSEELQGARGGYGYTATIPLREIAPGIYVLRVEARSRLSGNEEPVGRDVLIQVIEVPSPSAAGRREEGGNAALSVVPVVKGPRSEVDAPREVVARTPEEWQALWAMLPLSQASPKVNFENTMVAAVFLGSRPSSGFGVDIVRARLDGETLVIEYVEREPAEGAMTAQVVTNPYAVAGVPMHAGPVRFERVEAAGR